MANNFLELNGKVVDRFVCWDEFKDLSGWETVQILLKLSRDLGSTRGNSKCQWCQKNKQTLEIFTFWRMAFYLCYEMKKVYIKTYLRSPIKDDIWFSQGKHPGNF